MKPRSMALGLLGAALLAGAGVGVAQVLAQREAEQRVETFFDNLPESVTARYGGVEVGWLGRDLRVNDVQVQIEGGAPTRIEQIHFLAVDREHSPPHHLHATVTGIRQDLNDVPEEQVTMLRRLGYQEMRGSYEIRYHYDPVNKTLDLQELSGDMDDMAKVSLSLQLGNFELSPETPPEPGQMPEFDVRGLTLRYQDASLVQRVVRQGAEDQGVSEADFIAKVNAEVGQQLQAMEDPFYGKLAGQLRAFLETPGTLVITGRPAQPVPVVELIATAMITPAELPELLNLELQSAP